MESTRNKNWKRIVLARLQAEGVQTLSDAEVLSVLIGQTEGSQLASILAQEAYGIRSLFRMTTAELEGFLGVGTARAARVEAAFELGRRASRACLEDRPRFVNSQQIFRFVEPQLRGFEQEVFEVLVLDARNRLLRRERISLGTLTGSLVHPREVFRAALKVGACAIVLVHNHPSGDPTPSPEDIQVTDRLRRAGELLGIRVLDHVIVGDGRYVSLADRGHLAVAS